MTATPATTPGATVEFEVWRIDLTTGETRKAGGSDLSFTKQTQADKQADEWNAEEADNARMKMRRPVKTRFCVIEAVTTRREVAPTA